MIRRQPFFRVVRFTRSIGSARNALQYAAFRSEDARGRSPAIFDDRLDHADVKEFVHGLNDPITRHPQAAKAYHTVFSLSRPAFDRLHPGSDWQEMVRSVMRNYELQTQRRLKWIGVVHDNPTHPHVHVIIKAAYDTQSGTHRRLRLDRKELSRFREITGRELTHRGLAMTRERPVRSCQRNPTDRLSWALGGTLFWLQEQLENERRRRSREDAEDERLRRQEERER